MPEYEPHEPIIINIPPLESEVETQTDSRIKNDVYDNIIYKYIKSEIKELLRWEKLWKTIALIFTILKYICLVSVPILSLSSPYFDKYGNLFSYLSGALSSAGLGFERLTKLAQNISNTKKDKINILLKQIGVDYEVKDVDIITNKNGSLVDLNATQTPKKKY